MKKVAVKKTQPAESHTVVAKLERGDKAKMINKFLEKGTMSISEIRKAMAEKGITVYDSEVRRLASFVD